MAKLTAFSTAVLAAASFFSTTVVASAATTDIPFTFTDGFIRIEARIPQSKEPLHFLLDSGAGASVLSMRTARRLHLPLGTSQNVRGVGVDVAAYHLQNVQVASNGLTLAEIPLAVDLSAADQLCSLPVDGLVGVEFFRDRVVQIDYAHRVLHISPHTVGHTTDCLPVRLINGVMCVPVAVNDSTKRWTRFDTGCNDALHWVIPRPAGHGDRSAVSIGFITDESDTALVSVTLGKRALPTVKTALHGHPIFPGEAGLVGNGILSQFMVTVDWPNRQVLLGDAPR